MRYPASSVPGSRWACGGAIGHDSRPPRRVPQPVQNRAPGSTAVPHSGQNDGEAPAAARGDCAPAVRVGSGAAGGSACGGDSALWRRFGAGGARFGLWRRLGVVSVASRRDRLPGRVCRRRGRQP